MQDFNELTPGQEKRLAHNELTPAEAERLAYLLEETGKVQQAIGKILRHGYQKKHPDGGPNNREVLEEELAGMTAAMTLLGKYGEIDLDYIHRRQKRKQIVVAQWLFHSAG